MSREKTRGVVRHYCCRSAGAHACIGRSQGGQRVQTHLTGGAAAKFALLNDASQIQLGADGSFTLLIPEGETETLGLSAQLIGTDGQATHQQHLELNLDLSTSDNAQYDHILQGDLAPIDHDTDQAGVQEQYDALDNVLVHYDQPEPGRSDHLFDSTGNDHLMGKDGDDVLEAWRGGDDLLEGGQGSDIVAGGAGNDDVYADSYKDFDTVLQDNDQHGSSPLKGDWLDGGETQLKHPANNTNWQFREAA